MRRSGTRSSPGSVTRWVIAAGFAVLLARIAVPAGDGGAENKVLCAYHLMQLGRAIKMYAQDNNGYICALRGRVDWLEREGPDNAQRLKNAYARYITDPGIWYCPADNYAKTHTRTIETHGVPPKDQPDMAYDHFFTSYRHYSSVRGETPPVRLDAILVEQDEMTKDLPGGKWVATPDMIMLMMDDGSFHGAPATGQYGAVYARNVLFRDGHVKFETEETMRRPKP